VPSLVGRDRELALLRAYLDVALTGQGSLILIGGEAGIGKTVLAEAILSEAKAQGALVLVGRCYDLSETPPYGPWAEALERTPEGDGLPLLPAVLLPPGRAGEALPDQGAIIRRVRDYLAALACRRPVVLLLDDLHWADPASLDLLRALARQLVEIPALLLVTHRAGEVHRQHPLSTLLPLLVRESRAQRLDIRPLVEADMGALVAPYALPTADESRLVAYLAARAEGNPFFAGELLRALGEARVLALADGDWQLGGLEAVGVPPLLRQVIDARLDRLGVPTRDLLAVAAVIGQEVPLDLWAAASGAADAAFLAALESALAACVLGEAASGGSVRFAHALIREALYEGTSVPRRRALHRRTAEALLTTPDPDPDAVAHHLQRAGDTRAVDWLIAAAERAQRAHARRSAALRFESALALLPGHGSGAARRGWLLLRLTILFHVATIRETIALTDEAVHLAAECGDATLEAYARCIRGLNRCNAGEIGPGLADLRAGMARFKVLPAAASALPFAPASPDGLRRVFIRELSLAGRFAEAAALDSLPGVPVSGEVDSATPQSTHARGSAGHAHFARAVMHAAAGRPGEASAAFAFVRMPYREARFHDLLGWSATQELRWLALPYYPERPDYLRALASEAATEWGRAAEQRAGLPPIMTEELVARLPLLLVAGPWSEAAALIGPVLRDEPVAFWPRLFLGDLARLAYARGEWEEALALVRRGLPGGPATLPGECEYLPALVLQRVAAAVATARGDLNEAHAWLTAHDYWLAWNGTVLGRVEGQLGWAAYHRMMGDPLQARRYAEVALGDAAAPRQPLALLSAHRLLGELQTGAGDYDGAHRHLAAALSLANACAAPYERGLTLIARAEWHAATSDQTDAHAALSEARSLLIPLGAGPALKRADAVAQHLAASAAPVAATTSPAGLSGREVEVLQLLAVGQTNREIAATLFLSERTVHSHVRTILTKTRTNNRAGAAAFALRHGLA
jgi:DNA-binding CsgD family transcriptional regulator